MWGRRRRRQGVAVAVRVSVLTIVRRVRVMVCAVTCIVAVLSRVAGASVWVCTGMRGRLDVLVEIPGITTRSGIITLVISRVIPVPVSLSIMSVALSVIAVSLVAMAVIAGCIVAVTIVVTVVGTLCAMTATATATASAATLVKLAVASAVVLFLGVGVLARTGRSFAVRVLVALVALALLALATDGDILCLLCFLCLLRIMCALRVAGQRSVLIPAPELLVGEWLLGVAVDAVGAVGLGTGRRVRWVRERWVRVRRVRVHHVRLLRVLVVSVLHGVVFHRLCRVMLWLCVMLLRIMWMEVLLRELLRLVMGCPLWVRGCGALSSVLRCVLCGIVRVAAGALCLLAARVWSARGWRRSVRRGSGLHQRQHALHTWVCARQGEDGRVRLASVCVRVVFAGIGQATGL